MGKLRRNHEEETKVLNLNRQHQRNAQKITWSALAKLLSEVQVQMQPDECVCVLYGDTEGRAQQAVTQLDKLLTCPLSVLGTGSEAGPRRGVCRVRELCH